jgi:hypothetical protein
VLFFLDPGEPTLQVGASLEDLFAVAPQQRLLVPLQRSKLGGYLGRADLTSLARRAACA